MRAGRGQLRRAESWREGLGGDGWGRLHAGGSKAQARDHSRFAGAERTALRGAVDSGPKGNGAVGESTSRTPKAPQTPSPPGPPPTLHVSPHGTEQGQEMRVATQAPWSPDSRKQVCEVAPI